MGEGGEGVGSLLSNFQNILVVLYQNLNKFFRILKDSFSGFFFQMKFNIF